MRTEHGLLAGRWELGAAIGSGGFATVYRAHDHDTGASVAVKLVPPGIGEETVSIRLFQEAATLKKISSRFVAKVHEAGRGELGAWMVMELVEGVPLAPESLGRPLFPHEVLRVARGLFEGLAAAHACGIVHGDVKPTNILVPLAKDGLDAPKLIDFGVARVTSRADVASDLGEAAPVSGVVVGTARYMAPEVLRGAAADRRSDLYGAGLVLFELLGEGPLFHGATTSDELRARIAREPDLEGRVPLPLSAVLAKLLARDPKDRFEDASDALAAIVDLDTAPVSVLGDDIPPQSVRRSQPGGDPMRIMTAIPAAPPSVGVISAPRPSTMRPTPAPKLNSLPPEALQGLCETLRFLDLAMLDALARRERANIVGRIARAAALSLRLELDAAALILEPLAVQSDIARGVGSTLLAPRARRVTRARIDADREDKFIDTVAPELAGIFAALGAALSPREDGARNASRCKRALERLNADPKDHETARVTLRIALAASRLLVGEIDSGTALDLVRPYEGGDSRLLAPLDRVARSMALATICHRLDEGRARDELERTVALADESGTTLIEACAAASWGRLLVEGPGRIAQGLAVLERATTFLAHGDAPSLEHEAEHHRAAALLVSRRWDEAVPHLRSAREAAHAERSVENEILSASLEVLSLLAQGKMLDASETVATLGTTRISGAGGRAAALAWVARSLDALVNGAEDAAIEALADARSRAREADGSDALILVEVLGLVYDAARGEVPDLAEPAADLERFAAGHGFSAFYWFDVLRAVLDRLPDERRRAPMLVTLDRLAVLLGPGGRLARERRTSAPPPRP